METYCHTIVANMIQSHSLADSSLRKPSSLAHFEDDELLELFHIINTSQETPTDFNFLPSDTPMPDETQQLPVDTHMDTQQDSNPNPTGRTAQPIHEPVNSVHSHFSASASPAQAVDSQHSTPPDTNRPRCYEHGCAGRAFANVENYRRHLRERSNQNKTECPYCNCSFTRKGNRDAHLAAGRCKAVSSLLAQVHLKAEVPDSLRRTGRRKRTGR